MHPEPLGDNQMSTNICLAVDAACPASASAGASRGHRILPADATRQPVTPPPLDVAVAAAAAERHTGATPMPRRVWIAAWIVTAVFSLSNTATPLYRLWQAQMGFSSSTLTLIFAAYILGLLAALGVAGHLSDRLGRLPVLLPGLVSALAASLLFGIASSVWMLAIARFLTGVAVGIVVSAGMAAVVDAGGEDHKRGASLVASAAQVLGAGLGPLVGGTVSQWLALPAPIVYAIEGVVLLSALFAASRLDLHKPAHAPQPLHLPRVPAANRRHLLAGLAIYVPGLAGTTFVAALGPSLLARMLHVQGPLVGGAMVCAMFLSATAVQFPVRALGVRRVLILGAASIVLGMLAIGVAVQTLAVALLIGAAVLAGAGQGLGQLGALTMIASNVPAQRRAEATAMLNMAAYTVAGLVAIGTGFLTDAVGIASASAGLAVLLTAISVAGALIVRRLVPD
jgi:MFS family permease